MQKRTGRRPNAEGNQPVSKSLKSIGLFDHIKHIQYVRDPDYYEKLDETGKKSFNLFMILRGLSMNPAFLEYAAYFYRFLEIIPPAQFYKILIELYPRPGYKEFHRWIKSNKDKEGVEAKKEARVLGLLMEKYEISEKEAKDYLTIFNSSKEGKTTLFELIRDFGYSEKEVEAML